jgi:hypothetical protein
VQKHSVKYRGVWVAPSSDCGKALAEGDMKKAARLDDECRERDRKLMDKVRADRLARESV